MMSFDAIIVGSGINGLAAAVHLVSKGWKVVVVEASPTFGGAVRTSEATLPGFRHDLGAMNLSMFAGSPFYAKYRTELMAHGLALAPVRLPFASVFRDGTFLGVHGDAAETRRRIALLSDEDAGAWDQMLAQFAEDASLLFGMLNNRMPSFAALQLLIKAVRRRGVPWVYDLVRLLLSSPQAFLDRHFSHPKVKTMMAAWGMHLDFAPDTSGGALFPYLESMATQTAGMVIGKGGADTIIAAMVALIREKGGELFAGIPVTSIDTEGQRAVGVTLSDGRTIRAKRAVIANLHPKVLFDTLLDTDRPLWPELANRVSGFRSGPGTMMIHLAMTGVPKWTADARLSEFAYVHIAPDLAMMSRAYRQSLEGLLPREPVLVVGQPTAIDPTRAPDGKHILWIQVRTLPATIVGDAANIITGTQWDGVKDEYADRVLDLVEANAPGFKSMILRRTVVSPLDLERANPNLVGGDSLAGSHHLDQSFFLRPWAGGSRYKTPIKGLYMCGASTWPGAGTGGGSGYMLAQALVR